MLHNRAQPAAADRARGASVPYRLPGGRIGVATVPLYLRTLVAAALWRGVPPLWTRLLGRLGARGALQRSAKAWARGVQRTLGIRLDVRGTEHIAAREAYIVIPLHEGFADALALLQLPLRLRFVVRDELLHWRLLGPVLRDTGQIAICPEQGARGYRRTLREARTALAAGESVVIFPQGSILGIEAEFVGGAFRLARALGRPLLPVALTGSHRVWEHPYTPRLRYGERISLHVFPPIAAEQVRASPPDTLRRAVQQRLKAAALDGTMATPRSFIPERDGFWDGYVYRIDPAFPEVAAEVARHRAAASDQAGP